MGAIEKNHLKDNQSYMSALQKTLQEASVLPAKCGQRLGIWPALWMAQPFL